MTWTGLTVSFEKIQISLIFLSLFPKPSNFAKSDHPVPELFCEGSKIFKNEKNSEKQISGLPDKRLFSVAELAEDARILLHNHQKMHSLR
jgi:hypothetical protein